MNEGEGGMASSSSDVEAVDPFAPEPQGKMAPLNHAQVPMAKPIVANDNQTYTVRKPTDKVWASMLKVILKNYHVLVLDQKSGIISTDWDRYYFNNEVYRNKVTLHIRQKSWDATEVSVNNSIEKLDKDNDAVAGGLWLPVDDDYSETKRIINNMAILLRLPKQF